MALVDPASPSQRHAAAGEAGTIIATGPAVPGHDLRPDVASCDGPEGSGVGADCGAVLDPRCVAALLFQGDEGRPPFVFAFRDLASDGASLLEPLLVAWSAEAWRCVCATVPG
jgi:hypothetical protein